MNEDMMDGMIVGMRLRNIQRFIQWLQDGESRYKNTSYKTQNRCNPLSSIDVSKSGPEDPKIYLQSRLAILDCSSNVSSSYLTFWDPELFEIQDTWIHLMGKSDTFDNSDKGKYFGQ